MSAAKGHRPFDYVLLLLLGLSVSTNIWQALRPSAVASAATEPPAVKRQTLDGRPVSLTAPASGSLTLYVYSPDCVWCARNTPNISALASGRRSGTKLVGVCPGSTTTCQEASVGFDATIIPAPGPHAG